MEKEEKPAVEVVLTVLHAGGKFGDGGGYKVSGGLHGVGVSVVNALSEQLHVEVRRDGFALGPRTTRAAPRWARSSRARRRTDTGTTITFLPDAEIFESLDFDFATLEQRLRETAFLTRGLKISITDERGRGPRGRVPVRGRHPGLRRLPQREQGPGPAQGHLLRGRERRGRRRGGDAVELLLPGVHLLVRQQHQHPRGRHAPVRLPLGADPDAQPVRAREGPSEGEGRQPLRRGRPRGPHGGHLRQARRPAVRGPDQDQARQPRHGRASSSRSSTPSSPSSSRRTRPRATR